MIGRAEIPQEKIIEFLKSIKNMTIGEEVTNFVNIKEQGKIIEVKDNINVLENIDTVMLLSTGNIICRGDVRFSTIAALGKIEIKGECYDSNINSNNNVDLKIVIGSRVFSEEDISVSIESRDSELLSGGSINAHTAAFIGGRYASYKSVFVDKAIKPGEQINMSLIAGDRKLARGKFNYLNLQLKQFEDALIDNKKNIQTLVKNSIAIIRKGGAVPELEELKKRTIQLEQDIITKQRLVNEILDFEKSTQPNSFIQVKSLISRGVCIDIRNARTFCTVEAKDIKFLFNGEEIEVDSID